MIALLSALPLIPDGDQAREWAERELADPAYAAAEPTPFDRFARAVGDFLGSLFSGEVPAALGPWLAVVAVVVVVAVIAVAFAIWGRPRGAARSRRVPQALFGADEARSAAELRRDADAAAARGSWEDAIVLRTRALARGLAERTVVDPEPGATVHRFARSAAVAFPAEARALDDVADAFDDVRYLRRPGTEHAYRLVSELDARIAASTPAFAGAERMPA